MRHFRTGTLGTFSLLATLLLLSACKDNGGANATLESVFNGGDANGSSSGASGGSGGGSGGTGDSPPSISGSPREAVKIGDTYSFTPTVVETDGDTLNFYVGNQPRWADFNAKTGKISGRPGAGDVGTYTNIQVAVSDGSSAVYLPSFSVNVTQSGSSSTTVSWTPPTQNTDGSPLTDLAAYKIYYGVSEGEYTNQVRINNPGISTYVVDNLTPDTYYFVSTSINSSGVESDFSNVARKTVN